MSDTVVVVGSLHSRASLDILRCGIREPVSILIDYQLGQEATPKGFPKVYNRLITAAFLDPLVSYVWIVGDDVAFPNQGILDETQDIIRSDPTIGAIFPVEAWAEGGFTSPLVTILPFDGRKVRIDQALQEGTIEQIFAGFACACITRTAWSAVGPMDETLGLGYGEDMDWGLRCWRAGFRVVNYRGNYFFHQRGATYNQLVREGVMKESEPREAARRVKEKWAKRGLELWPEPPRENSHEVMKTLKEWYDGARANRVPMKPLPDGVRARICVCVFGNAHGALKDCPACDGTGYF